MIVALLVVLLIVALAALFLTLHWWGNTIKMLDEALTHLEFDKDSDLP